MTFDRPGSATHPPERPPTTPAGSGVVRRFDHPLAECGGSGSFNGGMATGVPHPESTGVVLPFGDPYLARIARELLRLNTYADCLDEAIAEHEQILVGGLASRRLTRLDLPDLSIRRVGRTGIAVG